MDIEQKFTYIKRVMSSDLNNWREKPKMLASLALVKTSAVVKELEKNLKKICVNEEGKETLKSLIIFRNCINKNNFTESPQVLQQWANVEKKIKSYLRKQLENTAA